MKLRPPPAADPERLASRPSVNLLESSGFLPVMPLLPSRSTRLASLAILPCAGVLALNIRRYWPFISDDALISLRYAQRLLEGHGLTWTEGPRVEGYSNLLWILLVAGAGLLGMDLVTASRVLGILGMLGVLFILARQVLRDGSGATAWLPLALSMLFVALSASVAVWAIGGLEQPLYGALLAAAISLAYAAIESEGRGSRTVTGLSLVLGLLCLTRPDGTIFAAAVSAALLLAGWSSGWPRPAALVMRVLLWPALCFGGQLAFRLVYYGEFVPNTALVKMPRSAGRWAAGFDYLTGGFMAMAPLSFLAVASLALLVALPRTRARGLCLSAIAVAWGAYVAFIGGDIFPAYRHFIPIVVVFAFALAGGSRAVMRGLSGRPAAAGIAAALGLAMLVPYALRQIDDRQSVRAVRERWEWDCRDLALQLKSAFGRQQPLVAVTAAGCLPYWSELPSLDMLGLNDHYLPRHPPADLADGFIGHDLGDGAYVLRSNPDLIVFNVGSGPHYRSGEELDRLHEFHARYVPVVLAIEVEGHPAIVYVNKYSERAGIGLARTGETIAIPGMLFTGEGARVHLQGPRGPVAVLSGPDPARVAFASPAGVEEWHVEVRTPSSPRLVAATLERDGESVIVTLVAQGTARVEVEEVVLRRPVGRS
jgi:arabinofuranosyltransferase